MKLHHIGIVVDDIEKFFGPLTNFLKIHEKLIPLENKSQKINYIFLPIGNISIELIQPISEISPINNFSKKGGGLHHIAFEVENIETTLSYLKSKGGKILFQPEIGFENRMISFVFMNSFPCKIIELVSKNME
jgi:methylmalonyl-CoA/ethylmalonyl-CoA epimerase